MTRAIKAEGISKEYTIGAQRPAAGLLVDQLGDALRHPLQTLRAALVGDDKKRFWALKDLDFEIEQGDILGVVGRNGAGKSTLLKILSRITDPSQGRALVRGRIASLLEVGTGFHPELSGRENIFLNATILGMRKKEIERKFDEIVAFSGVERFLATPVKHYSSGMYVRLAFAVAAHVDADVLLVDEVLAVGDADFQKRCLGKMGQVAQDGRTIVFVSHNAMALRNLCNTAILLESGRLSSIGLIEDVLAAYAAQPLPQARVADVERLAADSRPATVSSVNVRPSSSGSTSIAISQAFIIRVEITVSQPTEIGVFLHCYGTGSEMVFSSGSFFEKELNGLNLRPGRSAFECEVPGHLLNDGEYTLDVLLVQKRHSIVASESAICSFRIHDDSATVEGWHWRPAGAVRPLLEWRYVEYGETFGASATAADAEAITIRTGND